MSTQSKIGKLMDLGFRFNNDHLILGDIKIHWATVSCYTDKELKEKITEIKKVK